MNTELPRTHAIFNTPEIEWDIDLTMAYTLSGKTQKFDINTPIEPCPFALRIKQSKPKDVSVHQEHGTQCSNGVWIDRDLLFSLTPSELLSDEHGEAIAMLSHKEYTDLKTQFQANEQQEQESRGIKKKHYESQCAELLNMRRIYKNRISAKRCAYQKRAVIKEITSLYKQTKKQSESYSARVRQLTFKCKQINAKKNKYKAMVKSMIHKLDIMRKSTPKTLP